MSRWPLILLCLCSLALGLAACGGGDDDDVATILSETFGEGKEVESGRLDLAFRLNAQGLQGINGPVSVRLSGPFQSTGEAKLPQFDFNASLGVNGQQLTAGAVSTGDKGFLRFQNQPYAVSDDIFKQFRDGYAEQARCTNENEGEGGGQTFSSLGVRPQTWLQDAEKAGEEEVGGADTTHISGAVDVPKFLDDVNRILSRTNPQQADPCAEEGERQEGQPSEPSGTRTLTDEQRRQIAEAIENARVDIWTGADDRMLRRINVTLKFAVPEGQREAAGGLTGGELRFDMTLANLNEDQTIEAPENARPLEELAQQFGGQVPGLGGAQGGAAPGGTGGAQGGEGAAGAGAAGAGAGGSQYQQCLAQAGQDVQKLQECADLIGQ